MYGVSFVTVIDSQEGCWFILTKAVLTAASGNVLILYTSVCPVKTCNVVSSWVILFSWVRIELSNLKPINAMPMGVGASIVNIMTW